MPRSSIPGTSINGTNFRNQIVDLSRMVLADSVAVELSIEAEVLNSFGRGPEV